MSESSTSSISDLDLSKIEHVSKEAQGFGIDKLALMMYAKKLKQLEEGARKILVEIRVHHKEVKEIHALLRKINTLTNDEGNFKPSKDLIPLLKKAERFGLEFSKELMEGKELDFHARDRLVDDLRNFCDDNNTENDIRTQKAQRYHQERTTVINFTRKMLDTLHQTYMSVMRRMTPAR